MNCIATEFTQQEWQMDWAVKIDMYMNKNENEKNSWKGSLLHYSVYLNGSALLFPIEFEYVRVVRE